MYGGKLREILFDVGIIHNSHVIFDQSEILLIHRLHQWEAPVSAQLKQLRTFRFTRPPPGPLCDVEFADVEL